MADDTLLTDLIEWLRIPSVSTGGGDPAEMRRAARWVVDRIRRSGGTGEVVETDVHPLAVGELSSRRDDAPTVLLYGHYDVQSEGDASRWTTPPFAPHVRDGRVYARGASDDKGNVLAALHAACELSEAGELGCHVRVLIEGSEEAGGREAGAWLRADTRGADLGLIFDSGMLASGAFSVARMVRGLVYGRVDVRTATTDQHSGAGNALLSATEVLVRMLAAAAPDPSGRLPEPLAIGVVPPTAADRALWALEAPTEEELVASGGRVRDEAALAEYMLRTAGRPSFEIHGIAAGDAVNQRTIIPAEGRALFSLRLVPDQDPDVVWDAVCALLAGAAPPNADVTFTLLDSCRPGRCDPSAAAARVAIEAMERISGLPVAVSSGGGSIPIVADFEAAGIPVVLTGTASDSDAVHGVDESMRLDRLALGVRLARELYAAAASLR